ncbi:MAG: hypothetical protein EP338_11130 [Bacteroidetes bacterium]|nr:MAG: hypothetical protein EP338_11130 [Bacteroidota bacterium]
MNPAFIRNKKIVVASLNWGLGHVTRSVAIIKKLEAENEVIIAASEKQQAFFKSYFPELKYVDLKPYHFKFEGKGKWIKDLLRSRKDFVQTIDEEKKQLAHICDELEPDLIISDHRYGFFHPEIKSVFVTHQLQLPISKLLFWVQQWHERQLKNFDELWVLDNPIDSLAGRLSSKIDHPKIFYIGWQSRLDDQCNSQGQELPDYEYLIVVSGPDPYAQQFLDQMCRDFAAHGSKVALLYPPHLEIPKSDFDCFPNNDPITNDLLFARTNTVISRAGYSTLMDLKKTGNKGILFPTKGQYEQLYLAQHLQADDQFEFRNPTT